MPRGVARKGQGQGVKRKPARLAKASARQERRAPELPAETKPVPSIAPNAELEGHPFAAIFPMLAGEEAREFNAKVKADGVRVPVVLFEGKILDGRNRRRAAQLAGIMCPAEEYVGADALRYVIALNLDRRHLTESQRAMVAAEAEGFMHGGARRGEKLNAAMKREAAAKLVNVAPRSVARAAKVKAKGSPELVEAVRQGKVAVSAAAQAVDLPEADQKHIIAELSAGRASTAKKVLKRGRVKVRNEKLAANIVKEPTRQYAVILTDDEWKHETWSEQGQDRAAVMHYPVSDLEVLKARQLPAFKDAINYMWSVVPFQPEAYEVMKARGFTYRSQFVWHKTPGRLGLGYWSRIEHELLLIGTRGEVPCPAPGDNERSVQPLPKGKHSAKPERFYEIIEKYHAALAGHFIEFNARVRRRGWSAWGNEIGLVEPSVEHLRRELQENRLIEWKGEADASDADATGAEGASDANRGGQLDLSIAPGSGHADDGRRKGARGVSKAARPKAGEAGAAVERNDGIPDFLKRQAS